MPALVLVERDPWQAVIGSDSPTFALYEDGTVIRRKGGVFVSTKLKPAARDELLASVSADALRPFYGEYDADHATDQPTAQLLIYHSPNPVFISVYGALNQAEVRSKIPSKVLAAFDKLENFTAPLEQPWLPDKFEVMVWPYEYAQEVSTKWPKHLPDLRDENTIRRGESFSIFVPSSSLDEVRALLADRNEKGAIEINGRKWVASIRFPFLGEKLWMAPKDEVAAAGE